MVINLGNRNPKVLPDKITSEKGEPKLLHIAVKGDNSIALNKAENPRTIQPATPDPKKPTTKRALPQLSAHVYSSFLSTFIQVRYLLVTTDSYGCNYRSLPKFPNSSRFSCSASKSPPQHGNRMAYLDFPYVSPSHKDLMVDLASTVDTRLSSFLNPCNLPPDVQSYQNETGTAHAGLHLRSGLHSSPIDFMLGSWLHCALPSGGALNITSLSAYLNSSTDAPNFLIELIQSSPTSMVLILDLPPRVDLVLNPDYLKTFYEDTRLDQHREHLDKLAEVKPYSSSSLYIRAVVSPTAILVRIETERLEEMIETHVGPIAKEVLKTWLDVCAFGARVVGESERDWLKKRDDMSKSKTIEIDLGSNLPRLFGQETANRVLEALKEVF